MAGGVVVILLILMAVFAPLIVSWFGHPRTSSTRTPTCSRRNWAACPRRLPVLREQRDEWRLPVRAGAAERP
ncbi:hypothetical protein ACFQZ4_23885 [Catellatospora coxensis]